MLWQSINKTCDACQCSQLVTNKFQLGDGYKDKVLEHHDLCHHCTSNEDTLDADKENQHLASPTKHDNDISLYGNTSPSTSSRCGSQLYSSPSPKKFQSSRQSLEEFDLNSQDSGYGPSLNDQESKVFNFIQPKRNLPRKINEQLFTSPKSRENIVSFSSFSSGSIESIDDDFMELGDFETVDENARLPCDFNSLLSGSLKNETPVKNQNRARPLFRRSVSLKEGQTEINRCLFKNDSPDIFDRAFKRPDPPLEFTSPVQSKRYKCNELCNDLFSQPKNHPKIQRSLSENSAANIMQALQRSSTEPDLIGDFSKPFILPLITGKHNDLKSITPTTLADLMNGKYDSLVANFKVIDCRYPYEFEGGHISGALNFYTKEQIINELVERNNGKATITSDLSLKRNILVFHCEFSSERGPNLSRFLRNFDRTRNNESYPALNYPEIYLLDGGYKNFYEQYSELCEPTSYKPMMHPGHEQDLKHFRAKSKTWNADTRGRLSARPPSFKRIGFP